MNIRREPALLWMSLAAPAAQLLLVLVPNLEPWWQSVLGGVIPAIAGCIVAWLVRSESLVPAIVGVAQAVLAAILAWGVVLDADQQSSVLAFVGLVAGVVVRDRVEAPVPLERHV